MSISLTAGMRSNLINLQNTANLMDQTAIRLNTGKKVNSALDDPISFFTARNHTSRATDLATLKNGMSEAIQTITAANNGVEGIISLIEAAKAKAESAKSAEEAFATIQLELDGVTSGVTVEIGGTEYTAGATTAGKTFAVGITDTLSAANLAALINSNVESVDLSATTSGGTMTLADVDGAIDLVVATHFEDVVDDGSLEATLVEGSDELTNLASQYSTLMSQLDDLSVDAGYKGINLLANETLTVSFEGTNELDVVGFNATVAGDLALTATRDSSTSSWGTSANIDSDIDLMSAAIEKLETEASSLASSLSIVTTRQVFTADMINTLTTGADNLTLADMNEEGANMLMLQTQQALGTNSLSLAAQTAQGVLRLF